MINLILAVILGTIFAYFAIQNAVPTTVVAGNYLLTVPLYIVALSSLLIGLIISSLFSLAAWTSSALALSSKDGQIKKEAKIISDLASQVRSLQIENANLRGETSKIETKAELEKKLAHNEAHLEDHTPHLNFWERLRYSQS